MNCTCLLNLEEMTVFGICGHLVPLRRGLISKHQSLTNISRCKLKQCQRHCEVQPTDCLIENRVGSTPGFLWSEIVGGRDNIPTILR